MEESEDNMSAEDIKATDSPLTVKNKPKKRSLIERELETNLTERITSPAASAGGSSTSRYGRARRLKTWSDCDTKLPTFELKSPTIEKSPVPHQSPVYKMYASNSPVRTESVKKGGVEAYLDNQIENIYQENISLSRFTAEEKPASPSPAKKYPKVYIRKDLIQNKEPEETIPLIKNLFSPEKSACKSSSHLNNILERSSDRYNLNSNKEQNGYIDNSSVVKTLDFDSRKTKRDCKEKVFTKNELFEMEAKCSYQVGDLAWARMGTYPFWPCIITRDPASGIFVKKKLFGRVERDIIHVTFFGDNGRRGWIVDTMLRKYLGQLEFENARENFTPEAKKKDPKLYAAFFVSEKKQALWNMSVEEAEMLLREPKRLRIDVFNDILERSRVKPKQTKGGKICRTDSDVSLSESLYDSLFSEEDNKSDGNERSRNRSKNKSFDVFDVVTACLDNMAAKTGITKIQRQSHMDRWLQKAKSKTPEKLQTKPQTVQKADEKKEQKVKNNTKTKKKKDVSQVPVQKHYSLRKSINESHNLMPHQNEHNYSKSVSSIEESLSDSEDESVYFSFPEPNGLGLVNEESLCDKVEPEETLPEVNNSTICSENGKETGLMNGSCDSELDSAEDIDKIHNNVSHIEIRATPKPKKKGQSKPKTSTARLRSQPARRSKKQAGDSSFEIREDDNPLNNSRFVQYLELRQDSLMDENPELTHEEIVAYLYKTWLYEVSPSSQINNKENEEIAESNDAISDAIEPNVTETDTTVRDVQNSNEIKANEESEVTKSIESESVFKEPATESDSIAPKAKKSDTIDTLLTDNSSTRRIIDAMESSDREKNSEDSITDIDESTNIEPISIDPNETCDDDSQDSQSSNNLTNSSTEKNPTKVPDIDTKHNNENVGVQDSQVTPSMVKNNPIENIDSYSKNVEANDMSIDEDYCSSDSESLPYSDLTDPADRVLLKEALFDESIIKLEENESKTTEQERNVESPTFTQVESPTFTPTENDANIENETVESPYMRTKSPTFTQIESETPNDRVDSPTYTQEESIASPEANVDEIKTDIKVTKDVSQNNVPVNSKKAFSNDNVAASIVENGHIDTDSLSSLSNDKFEKHSTPKMSCKTKNDSSKALKNTKINISDDGLKKSRVKEINISPSKEICITNCIAETPKENGFHYDDDDIDTMSVHSEGSVTSTKSGKQRKLRSKLEKIHENPLDNPEFVKYLEIRQDALMDENPELTYEQIVAYLHKTWLYEESAKSEEMKIDDLREANLVKGVSKSPIPKKSLSLAKHSMQKFLQTKPVEKKPRRTNSPIVCIEKIDVTEKNNIENKQHVTSKDDGVKESKELNGEVEQKLPKKTVIDSKMGIENSTSDVTKVVKLECINEDEIKTPSVDAQNVKAKISDDDGDNFEPKDDYDRDSIDSEDSETPLIKCKLRSKSKKEHIVKESSDKVTEDDTVSIHSTDSESYLLSLNKRRKKASKKEASVDDPEFIKYLELRQDALIDEHPELSQKEIVDYLYKTWLYEENNKSETKKNDEIEQSNLVKGLNDGNYQPKKIRRPKIKAEKDIDEDVIIKDKPKRKSIKPFYNEEYSDIEEELEVFEIFKKKTITNTTKEIKDGVKLEKDNELIPVSDGPIDITEEYDEIEHFFQQLTQPKPNIFKGLTREKVCEICEKTHTLIKCKGCNGMFHADCVKRELDKVEQPAPSRGRKKKKKMGRKPKSLDEYDSQDDNKSLDVSKENISADDIIEPEPHVVDADTFEAQLEAKMKELLDTTEVIDYGDVTSEDEIDWNDTVPGKCEIVDIKLKPHQYLTEIDYSAFKCNNCRVYDTPICFVCRKAESKTGSVSRQKCHVAHCHKFYHLECLEQWPQTQFNGGEPSKNNKKISEHFEALTCPRHVCHTCVSDDPRGCKTRFSGDKLARCVRCPATYHSFTKCLPAGTQILSASHIICPRHVEHRPGKVPVHVNTGWCFICALGGSLICCEYCPTSFHAECLNISPPEGGYMCEDCETGRLPLYGEMVWVKLGHYRWWPGLVLHPSEIPENILTVKHSMGEFVVRFFGQYDHYWVNRGRVFPFQEGDSGRISSQKSKIDAAFTTAMEHAQRACEILKTAQPNEEETLDIASSLLPPHYVKLKVNKPCGSLCGRRAEDPESSLTQCECNPLDLDPCGPYSQCLNRVLLTECGPTCRAGDRCNNRAFERRSYPKLVPYRTPSRGWGLKTLENIRAGQFVIEYVGELIDEEEFRRRMRRKHEIRDENFYFLTLDKERMIDAGPKGNLARFMNHCCEPNCETQKWTVLGDVRVGLFALYDIPANSEVTFNYNLECAGIDKKRCMCGAKRCSGYIGAKPKQDEPQSKKNKSLPGKRTYKKRKPEESPSTKPKPKRPLGRPPKPRELTEIEKDLLIIKNATNNISSDESTKSLSSECEQVKPLKRKRVSFSSEENDNTNSKRSKIDSSDVGD